MRTAQVVETLDAGGAEGLAVGFANALAARGHDSHLIVMDGSGPFRARVDAGVHLHDLGFPPRVRNFAANALYFRGTYQAFSSVLEDRQIEVVQTHLPRANFLGLFAGRNRLARVHPTVHNNREFDYGDRSNALKDYLRKRAYRKMLSWCGTMIAVSEQVAAAMAAELDLGRELAGRITAVPNGVAVPDPLSPAERTAARADWSVGESDVLLVAVGRLSHQKNFSSLVEALSRLAPETGNWKCVIAGEGELKGELESMIRARGLAEKVTLAGHVADVGRLFGAGDVFCLSSRYEGLPLVLLEAMAAGLPVCAYGIDGVIDVVAEGEQAVLAKPENPGSLAAAIGTLLADPGARRTMGAAGRALVTSRYNFESVVDQLEELYRT